MIQPQTYLTVADNTGAKKIMCIRVLGNNRKYAAVGDVIIGVVKEALPNMAVKRSSVIRAVVVRTKKTIKRQDGMGVRFDDNAAVIINTENNTLKKLQHNLDISYERLENEKKKTFNLQNTINELQNRLDNQVNELSSTHIERPVQSTQKPSQQSMRTSISDLMDDSDDETIETKPQTINDIAKRLQEGRQQS